MASLRDTFTFADPGLSQQGLEELQVQNMGTLRKTFEGGRIGHDANAAASELASLRAAGRNEEADALQAELQALTQRQGLYAPEIGGVENIGKHGSIAGDAATWALESVGQGAASMVDPIAVSAAMNAGGKLLGMSKNPTAQLVSKALSWGAPAVAYGMNHDQLKGEFVQNAMRDPELMARTSWQDLNRTANVQAAGGALLDTVVPAVLGRQLVGKAGMSALGKLAPTSFGGRTLAAMGLEGATEVGQNVGSQIGLGHLNPNRDTSGDFMDNVNAFAGGAVGAGPFSAAGAAAEGGYQRLGGVADALGKKAGDTVDLATGAVDSAKEKSRGWADKLFGKKEAEDLQGEDLQAGAPAAFSMPTEELDALRMTSINGASTDDDIITAEKMKYGVVLKHLKTLAETDEQAASLLQRVNDPNPNNQFEAIDQAADYLEGLHNDGLREELNGKGNNLGRTLGKAAGALGTAAIKGAVNTAKNVIGGVVGGARSKKNLQADGPSEYTLEDWEATQAGRRAAAEQALASTGPSARKAEQKSRMNLAARQAAEFTRTKYQGKEGLARMASHTAFELIDASRDFRRSDVAGVKPGARNARLGRVADTMRKLYGAEDAMKMADTIASIVGQDSNKYLAPAVEYVKAEIQRLDTPAGRIQAKQERQELAGKLASLVPPKRENFLLDKGINIRGQDADRFVSLLEDLADGTAPRDTRQELNRLFGAATVNNLLAELNQQAIASGKKETFKEAVTFANAPAESSEQLDVNDDGEVSSDDRPSDYDQRMGAKKVERGASGVMVAFDKASTTMSKGSGVDVFSGTPDLETGEVKRPWLFKKGQKLFNGGDAIKNRIANLRGELKGRTDSYKVAARSAWDVMTEDGVQPGRLVAAYRDYLRQEASADERRSKPQYTEEQRKAMRLEAMDAARYVLDTMTPPKKGEQYRLPVGRRKELAEATKKYFQERFVVTAESPSDRVSNRIDLDELNKMISATKKVVDLARMPGQDQARLFNENNIISFTRRVKGEDKPAHVRADDLMKWGRKQRLAEEEFSEQTDFSNDNADDQYVADLMSAITAVMDSGFVRKKMPTKINMQGQIESFADGIPPSLRLVTTTQGKRDAQREANAQKGAERLRKMGPKVVAAAEGRKREAALAEVEQEQSDSGGAGPEMAGATRDAQPEGFPEGMPGFPTQGEVRKSRETLRARMEASGELGAQDPRTAITVPGGEKKTSRDSAVPSETENQRETDDFGHKIAQDEFSDQRYRSRVEGFKPDANLPRPKSVMRAYTDASRDAAEIVKALTPLPEGKEVVQVPGALGRPAEGFAMIEARLRAAARLTSGGGLLGGMHFILPVLKVLNGDKLGTYDFSPEEAVKATELRARAAQAILDSEVVGPQRVRMAKELATAVVAERITEDNANTALQRIAQAGKTQAAPEVAAQEAPKAQAKPSGVGGVDLGTSGPYTKKDQAKSDQATKFIGRGSERSSTAKYAKAWGERANTGAYTSADVVFVSAEGNRSGRVSPDLDEIGRAVEARATIITDDKANREREYNVGEREVAKFLTSKGYRETSPGRWTSASTNIANRAASQGRKLNAQDAREPRAASASPEEIAKAKAWMNKVLPKVRVEFEKITGYSGEFIEAENLVRISTTAAAGVMQTAYHEGLHAFFAGLAKNPEAQRVLSSIADNRVIFNRLQALLHKYPAAKAQLVDGEERLAYAFQFWAAGKLQLPVGPAKGFFAKLRKFFRQVAGMIKDEERAADILQAFNDGKLGDPSTAGKVLNDIMSQGTWTKKGLKQLDGLMQRVRQLIMPTEEILMRAPSAEAKALARRLFTNPGDEGSAGMQEGLLNAQRTITTKEMNRFANAIEGLDDKDMANVAKLMEAKTPLHEIPYAPYRKAVKEIRQQLSDFGGKDGYLQKSGMEMGTVKDDYFPRVWSLTKLIDDREGFVKMLMDNYPERLAEIAGAANLRNTKNGKLKDGAVEMDNKAAAEEITNYLIRRNGTDGKVATQREDGVLAPYFAAGERREFAWIETEHSEPWQNKNLIGIMTGYLHEGVRSAEYTRRFGRKGEHLDASLRTIEAELTEHARAELAKGEFKDQKAANAWVTRQMRGIRQATGGMEGSLGKDISNGMRKFNSWMMVYQNVRLLPLTLFASVVDPMGMIARGATMREAFEAFQRGIREVFRGWADLFRQDPKGALSDKWTKLAEHIGAVDAAILSHHASEEYSSTYLTRWAKRINDAFFKINGMEAWNRGMRVGAVKSAAAFIARHKSLPDVHSARWLQELGLTPDAITLDADGDLITDVETLMAQTGATKGEAQRQIDAIHSALNRWVLGAILTPNAAQRPAWASDPHYSLFFHLKQFSYSFHQTILKRAVKEMNHGNLGPIATFAGYIPVMLASDLMKGLIVGGGELPAHMKGMDLGDHIMRAINRTGTLGIAQIGVDASHDMFSVLGPSAEQVVDGITSPIADTTLRALPLNPILRAVAE